MSEPALLRAVRDRLRAHVSLSDAQVDVELDEMAPAVVGPCYIMVISAGTEPGPSHETNQGARDILYNVDVTIALRAPKTPRDRRRDLFLSLTKSFSEYQGYVMDQVDFKYEVNDLANSYIGSDYGSSDYFKEALKFTGTGRFAVAPASLFAGTTGEDVAAVIRTVHFRGARRLEQRTIS